MKTPQNRAKTVEEYIQSFPQATQVQLNKLRKVIKEIIPQAEETMSYNMPTYALNGKYLVYFAFWKKHISLYPFSTEMKQSIPGLSDYKTSGKGTIQFPLEEPLPLNKIQAMVLFLLKQRSN